MKSLSIYFRRHFKALSKHLFQETAGLERFHDIRLEIKKIKALINLTQFCVKGFKGHKYYIPFRIIFRMAGKIRQADVVRQLSATNKQVKGDHPKDSATHRQQIKEFQNETAHLYSIIKKKYKKIRTSLKNVKRAHFKKYLKQRKRELRSQLFPRLNKSGLHKTRKVIKEIVYLSPLAKKREGKLNPFYDNLQELVGQWHDKQVLISSTKIKKEHTKRNQLIDECEHDITKIKKLTADFYQK